MDTGHCGPWIVGGPLLGGLLVQVLVASLSLTMGRSKGRRSVVLLGPRPTPHLF